MLNLLLSPDLVVKAMRLGAQNIDGDWMHGNRAVAWPVKEGWLAWNGTISVKVQTENEALEIWLESMSPSSIESVRSSLVQARLDLISGKMELPSDPTLAALVCLDYALQLTTRPSARFAEVS